MGRRPSTARKSRKGFEFHGGIGLERPASPLPLFTSFQTARHIQYSIVGVSPVQLTRAAIIRSLWEGNKWGKIAQLGKSWGSRRFSFWLLDLAQMIGENWPVLRRGKSPSLAGNKANYLNVKLNSPRKQVLAELGLVS